MLDKSQKDNIKLSDVIDIKFLQELQDNFAKSMNMASITVDTEGPVTNPSNFTEFCIKHTRGSAQGFLRCNECDIKWGKRAAEEAKPMIYSCHSGLTDFAVPIMIEGKHIGSILGGQVLTREPDEEHFRSLARELGINENEYIEAVRNIRIISPERVEAAAQLLFIVANSISEIALKNFELIKKNQRNLLLNKTIEIVRSSLNPEEIKEHFVEITANYFNADRCLFVDYDITNEKFIPFRLERLKSPDIKSLLGVSVEDNFPEFAAKLKNKKRNIIIKDLEKTLSRKKLLNYKAIESLSGSDAKSDYGFVVQYKEQIIGILILHFINEKRVLTSEELDFLKALRDQVGIALYQNQLYEKERKTAERETILRKIIEVSRNSLDATIVKQNIVNELGAAFKAERCYFRAYDRIKGQFLPPDVEYLSSSDVPSLLHVEPHQEGLKYFSENLRKHSQGFYPVVANANFAKGTPLEDYMKSAKMVANYAMPIIDREDGFTWLVLHYSEEDPKFDEDTKKLLETIAYQVDMALEQLKLYNTVRQTAEREKAILNNLPFIAWLKDAESRYLNVNEPYAKFCNHTVEEMVGKSDFEVQPEELAQKYRNDDINVMESGKLSTEEQIASADGTYKWYETFKTPVFDQEGNVIGTTGFARDITEQKEVERMKNEFVSVISHELRTPLTSIRAALGLIATNALGTLPDKINSVLNIANNNTIRLINLINDILDLEKIKAGKMDFSFEEYAVMPLIEETVKLNEEYAKQYNVKYVIKNKLDDILVNVDKNRFIQVLTNLLSNAAKFSYQNEEIHISVERKKHLISVSVTNKGKGIPEKSFSKIFQQFSQVDSSDTRGSGGTGLGLSICKSIIEKMGGTIGFTSKLEEYTTFYFELPEILKNKGNKSVLICDDNKTTVLCIKAMFEKLDYNTDIAFTAAEAMQLLQTKTFDLMTLDLLLPDQDGLTLLDNLRHNEKTKNLPVLIISVKKPDLEIIKQEHQVIDWLEKSFDIDTLEKTINKVMRNKNKNKIEILHVENDKDILGLIDLTLRDIANITQVKSLIQAENIIKESTFDIIILDYMFPDETSDKLIPAIKSGPNKNAKLIVFSAYEESKILTRYVDSIILKTNVSNEQFKACIKNIIDLKDEQEIK